MNEKVSLFLDHLVDAEDTDKLNHYSYAQVIRRVIQQTSSTATLNIGIFGPWGVGKSSIMSMVQAALPAEYYCCVNINAWRLGGNAEALRRSIVIETNRALGTEGTNDEIELYNIRHEQSDAVSKTVKDILGWLRRHKHWVILGVIVAVLLPIVLPAHARTVWTSIVSSITATLPVGVLILVLEFLLSTLSGVKIVHIREPISSVEQFSQAFDRLAENAKNKGKRLVYFVDDVDRLHPEQLIETLRTVKTFFDRPGCTFVMACNDKLLTEALTWQLQKEEQGDGVTDAQLMLRAREYIDKIFQVRVYVNPTDEGDTVAFARRLITEAGLELENIDDVLVALIHSDVTTPRQVKRQLNDFLIALSSAGERARGVAKGVEDERVVQAAEKVLSDVAMLAKLVTIRSTWPSVYERLFHSRDVLATLTAAAWSGNFDEALSEVGVTGLADREIESLRGYLVRTRHIEHPDLASFLYLRPSDAAIRLGLDERTRDILKAVDNGDVWSVREMLQGVDPDQYEAWLEYLLNYTAQADPASRRNRLVSTSAILAVVESSILRKHAEHLAVAYTAFLTEDIIVESEPNGVVKAMVHQTDERTNVIRKWIQDNLLTEEVALGALEKRYLLALLRNWDELRTGTDSELPDQLWKHLCKIAETDVDGWLEFVSFCVNELDRLDGADVRARLVDICIQVAIPNEESWPQYEEAITLLWPPSAPERVAWNILLDRADSCRDDEHALSLFSSLAWRYASALTARGLGEEEERRVSELLLRDDALGAVLETDRTNLVHSLAPLFASRAPDNFGRALTRVALSGRIGETGIPSVFRSIFQDLDEPRVRSVIPSMLDEASRFLVKLHKSKDRFNRASVDGLYQLVDAIKVFVPDQVGTLIVFDLNGIADSVRDLAEESDEEKRRSYGSLVIPLFEKLLELLDEFPEQTLPVISPPSYYASASDYQAFLAISLRQRAQWTAKMGDHYTIGRCMRYSEEGAVVGILEMVQHKDWDDDAWTYLLSELVHACARHPGLLDRLRESMDVDVLKVLKERFGTTRAVVGRLVVAAHTELPTIDHIVSGMHGFRKGTVEGLCKELERTGRKNDVTALAEVASYLRPLLGASKKQIRNRIFRAWSTVLDAMVDPEVARHFIEFYEDKDNLTGNLSRLEGVLRGILERIHASPNIGSNGLLDAITEVARAFDRDRLQTAVSRTRTRIAAQLEENIRKSEVPTSTA